MQWSLSEYLNVIELRGQTWCLVELGDGWGFRVSQNPSIFFYAVIEGTARIANTAGGLVRLNAGDIALVFPGQNHAVRFSHDDRVQALEFLQNGEYADTPAAISLAHTGRVDTRLMCGRLKVRWPGDRCPKQLPSLINASDLGLDLQSIVRSAKGPGAAAELTRLATWLFIRAFREHPQCQSAFSELSAHSPVTRAREFIEKHPHHNWTVHSLARKVGMGRSTFAARFTAEVGRSPISLLCHERLKHAVDLLRQTDLTIVEISERVGYKSGGAFSNRFKVEFGMTPGQMRKTGSDVSGAGKGR